MIIDGVFLILAAGSFFACSSDRDASVLDHAVKVADWQLANDHCTSQPLMSKAALRMGVETNQGLIPGSEPSCRLPVKCLV